MMTLAPEKQRLAVTQRPQARDASGNTVEPCREGFPMVVQEIHRDEPEQHELGQVNADPEAAAQFVQFGARQRVLVGVAVLGDAKPSDHVAAKPHERGNGAVLEKERPAARSHGTMQYIREAVEGFDMMQDKRAVYGIEWSKPINGESVKADSADVAGCGCRKPSDGDGTGVDGCHFCAKRGEEQCVLSGTAPDVKQGGFGAGAKKCGCRALNAPLVRCNRHRGVAEYAVPVSGGHVA